MLLPSEEASAGEEDDEEDLDSEDESGEENDVEEKSNLAMKMKATTAKLNAAPVAKPNARLAPFASYEASKVLRVVIVVVLVGIGAACS